MAGVTAFVDEVKKTNRRIPRLAPLFALSVCLSVCVSVSLLNFPSPSLPSLPLASPFKASPSAGFNPCPDNPARDNTSFYDWLATCSSYLASVGIRGIFVDYRPGNEPARRKPRCSGPGKRFPPPSSNLKGRRGRGLTITRSSRAARDKISFF